MVNCSPVPTTKPWRGYKVYETISDVINPRRRVRGPGLQPRVGRVPSRGAAFDAVYIVGTSAGRPREVTKSGDREAIAVLQSQRDCALGPRVARNELPWVGAEGIFNPNGVVSNFRHRAATPLGLFAFCRDFPG